MGRTEALARDTAARREPSSRFRLSSYHHVGLGGRGWVGVAAVDGGGGRAGSVRAVAHSDTASSGGLRPEVRVLELSGGHQWRRPPVSPLPIEALGSRRGTSDGLVAGGAIGR
jgi:hypothetical protein